MEMVRYILQKHFQRADWAISHPSDGQHQSSYIAESKKQKVFIKCDVPIDAIQRLSEIEVAPRVLASGFCADTPYVVQEYIAGQYPDRQWFANHLPFLAGFLRRYHFDEQLTSLLSLTMSTDYSEHIAFDMATLETQFMSLDVDVLHDPNIVSAVELLKKQSLKLRPANLVPVHPDPNTKNMLLVDSKLFLVDWDDVLLSDPMRDIGLLLWWYVSSQKWSVFFQAYDSHLDQNAIERMYWWTARTSFAVALWQVEHKHDCSAFLQDFVAALNKGSNPHANFQ